MRFPGTITVPDDVFEKTLESAANGFKVHGFRNIVFLGDHGGYQDDVRRVVARLNKSWAGSDARAFVPAEYYATSYTGNNLILLAPGVRDADFANHPRLPHPPPRLPLTPHI